MDNTNNEASVELRELMASQMYDANVALDRVRDALKDSDDVLTLMVLGAALHRYAYAAQIPHEQAIVRLLGAMKVQAAYSRLMPGTEKHQQANTEGE
jgi:hypothetical protein